MNKFTVEDLLNLVKSYNPDEVEIIKRAYYYANNLHSGQKNKVENLILLIHLM